MSKNQVAGGPKPLADRQTEAEDYLRAHKVNELFANITAHLVFSKPDNPKESIIDYLERLKKAKLTNVNPPTLFEDSNLESIFGILDPSGKGSITYKQYCEALKTLNIDDYDINPTGKAEDKIKLEIFTKEAKRGLQKLNATYKQK